MFSTTLPIFDAREPLMTTTGTLSSIGLRVMNQVRSSLLQQTPATVFANLPAKPITGMVFAITDATVNTWGSVIAGGGANTVLGFFNGTNWTVIGK